MANTLGFRIALGLVGLCGLTFGVFTGYSHGFQLDVVNLVTIGASVIVLVAAIFLKGSEEKSKSIQPQYL